MKKVNELSTNPLDLKLLHVEGGLVKTTRVQYSVQVKPLLKIKTLYSGDINEAGDICGS